MDKTNVSGQCLCVDVICLDKRIKGVEEKDGKD